jgi:hypothetical protein
MAAEHALNYAYSMSFLKHFCLKKRMKTARYRFLCHNNGKKRPVRAR